MVGMWGWGGGKGVDDLDLDSCQPSLCRHSSCQPTPCYSLLPRSSQFKFMTVTVEFSLIHVNQVYVSLVYVNLLHVHLYYLDYLNLHL